MPALPSLTIRQMKARYNYTANHNDELSFRKGDQILILAEGVILIFVSTIAV
jgi:hypothetical protein